MVSSARLAASISRMLVTIGRLVGWTSARAEAMAMARPVARRVLQTVDIAAILRKSTETVTSEAIQGVRLRGADADLAVDRWLGRRPHPIA